MGYGDFSPQTAAGKLLTVFYIFCGIGLLVALLTRFAEALIHSAREDQERLHQRLSQARKKIAGGDAGADQPRPAEPPAVEEEHHS